MDVINTTWNHTLTDNTTIKDESSILYPLPLVIPITVVYALIFFCGVIGNISTCIVIATNKSMHTATNYYLFSLAMSDLLLLISGLPPEMYRIWSPETYVFGEAFCILQGFAAETSANATVLTITAFTVERYVAICHPFLSHTMSKLSRAIKLIVAIWIVALCLAAPQAIQFGVEYELKNGVQYSRCTVVSNFFQHAFEISTFLFFVGPMTLITVLYVLIGVQLRQSSREMPKRGSLSSNNEPRGKNAAAQNRVVKMLIAVVAAFFICWAPFHAQRLLAVYLANASTEPQETAITIYMVLMYASGILYFLSTTINPVLYNIMSNKFREAFKKTLRDACRSRSKRPLNPTYSILSRGPASLRQLQPSDHRHEQLTLQTTSGGDFLGPSTTPAPSNFTISGQTLNKTASNLQTNDKTISGRMLRLFNKQKTPFKGHFWRHGSVDSTHTISNSSLQDMDEIDYSSSDLVKYMEEINEDIA